MTGSSESISSHGSQRVSHDIHDNDDSSSCHFHLSGIKLVFKCIFNVGVYLQLSSSLPLMQLLRPLHTSDALIHRPVLH